MNTSGTTSGATSANTFTFKVQWGFCSINPISQAIEYYVNERKKHG